MMGGIYVASKAKYAPNWLHYRAKGFEICSSWLDEYAPGATHDWSDLWQRAIREASKADVLVIYQSADDVMKGALVELGAALGANVPVFAIGLLDRAAHHPLVKKFDNVDIAMSEAQFMVIRNRPRCQPPPNPEHDRKLLAQFADWIDSP